MNDVLFSDPIRLKLGPTDERKVASAWEAIECLHQQWPEWAQGRTYRAAFGARRDALDGCRPPKYARRALVKAARRAGLLAT